MDGSVIDGHAIDPSVGSFDDNARDSRVPETNHVDERGGSNIWTAPTTK